ncbi:hypothetical protein Tco_1057886 [Tanacetum coccineum]|uniref:Uncharacterized protein n=1 Tax=Tanacetum coccineum TaxID=301880 RepID=A0ABQ5H6V6_9ASTR
MLALVGMATGMQGDKIGSKQLMQEMVRGYYARDYPKPKVRDAKYFREQMLLAMKDEAKGILNDEENDFMLDNAYGNETLEELTVAVIMMARIQPAYNNAETEPKYDVEAVSKQKELVQRELKTCKEWVKTLEFKSAQCSKYKETCDDLEREIRADKDTIERILKEKDKIEKYFFKSENEKIIIQNETRLAKKAFKARENSYLEDIVDLNDKLSSYD